MKKLILLISALVFVATAPAQVQTQPIPAPGPVTQQALSLQMDFSVYCVGQTAHYSISGSSSLKGLPIYWTSTYQPYGSGSPPVFNNEGAYPGQTLKDRGDGTAYWSGQAALPWTIAQTGNWTKTATIISLSGRVSGTVSFQVGTCPSYQIDEYNAQLVPADGSTLLRRLDTVSGSGVVNISLALQNLLDPTLVKGWRVVLNNQNITSALASVYGDVFQYVSPDGTAFYSQSAVYSLPIPFSMFQEGDNRLDVEVDMQDGSSILTGAGYTVRSVDDSFKAPGPPSLPDSPLVCVGVYTITIYLGDELSFLGSGGNGTYFWSAPTGTPSQGQGRIFFTSFNSPGVQNITVTSNGQKASCSVTVVNSVRPTPAPPSFP